VDTGQLSVLPAPRSRLAQQHPPQPLPQRLLREGGPQRQRQGPLLGDPPRQRRGLRTRRFPTPARAAQGEASHGTDRRRRRRRQSGAVSVNSGSRLVAVSTARGRTRIQRETRVQRGTRIQREIRVQFGSADGTAGRSHWRGGDDSSRALVRRPVTTVSRKRLFDVDSLLAPDVDKQADEQPEIWAPHRPEIDSTTVQLRRRDDDDDCRVAFPVRDRKQRRAAVSPEVDDVDLVVARRRPITAAVRDDDVTTTSGGLAGKPATAADDEIDVVTSPNSLPGRRSGDGDETGSGFVPSRRSVDVVTTSGEAASGARAADPDVARFWLRHASLASTRLAKALFPLPLAAYHVTSGINGDVGLARNVGQGRGEGHGRVQGHDWDTAEGRCLNLVQGEGRVRGRNQGQCQGRGEGQRICDVTDESSESVSSIRDETIVIAPVNAL